MVKCATKVAHLHRVSIQSCTQNQTQTQTQTHLFKQDYCNRTNFRTRFNFVYFVLLAESTKFSSIRKPYTYACVSDTTVAVRKFVAYERWQTLEYEIFTRTKISAITVQKKYNYLSELRSCEKRVEVGGREETAGVGGGGGGRERKEGEKLQWEMNSKLGLERA